MGLIVSQLGNVVQSSVEDRDPSEAGGIQNTAQQLGSSLGTALLGAIVITGLIAAFLSNIADDPRVSGEVEEQVQVSMSAGASSSAAEERAQVRELGLHRGAEPVAELEDRGVGDPVDGAGPLLAAGEEALVAEGREVLGDVLLAGPQRLGQFADRCLLPATQDIEDAKARRVGKRPEAPRDQIGGIGIQGALHRHGALLIEV